jgi:hypothetical protein
MDTTFYSLKKTKPNLNKNTKQIIMVARKPSLFETAGSCDKIDILLKQRPSVYIDPESNIFEGLQYLQSIERENCTNCYQLWRSSTISAEGKIVDKFMILILSTFYVRYFAILMRNSCIRRNPSTMLIHQTRRSQNELISSLIMRIFYF